MFIAALLSIRLNAQDSANKINNRSGQVTGSWLWITIIIIAALFLIFAVSKSKKAKSEVVKDENKNERVIENTKPDH